MKTLEEASRREVSNMTAICQKLQNCMADLSENWNKVDELLSELREYGWSLYTKVPKALLNIVKRGGAYIRKCRRSEGLPS